MLKSFKIGGIHPKDNKISAGEKIEQMPIQAITTIYLSQHIGAPATAIVKKGDSVKVGDLIGKSSGFISANIHSSVCGIVKSVDNVKDSSGTQKMAVTITVAPEEEWNENIIRDDKLVTEFDLSPEDITKRITEAGIVGLGGATFPTNVKLMVPNGKKATALVVNGVECEPYLTADHSLMLEKADEILVGIRIVCKALNVNTAYVGIENNKIDAINLLKKKVANITDTKIIIVALKLQYPQGSEKQLIDATMNKRIPSGGLPIDVGAVVQNVGTIFAIYEAIQKNKPLFERIVTVTGKPLTTTKNLKVRVGTPIKSLIEFCGGIPEDTGKIIGGGPMMGRAMANLDGCISKGSSGVLLMNEKESKREKETSCIRCAKCVGVCPMGLEPYHIIALTRLRKWDEMMEFAAYDCIECGSCSFICPAQIPLLDNIRIAKSESMKILRSKK